MIEFTQTSKGRKKNDAWTLLCSLEHRKINQEIAGKRQKLTERWTDEGQKENKEPGETIDL